jgi:hypothetical protein
MPLARDASAGQHGRRQLIGQRLARARGHHGKGRFAAQHPVNHPGLNAAKGGEAESGLQYAKRIGMRGSEGWRVGEHRDDA